MPKLSNGLTNVPLSSDSEHDHALHDLSSQRNVPAGDHKIDSNASQDWTNSQPNFTEVGINSRSAEPTGDTENRVCYHGRSKWCSSRLIREAWIVPVNEEEEANRLIDQVPDLQKTLDDLTSRMNSVNEDELVLRSESQVLSHYIENVMHDSFQQMSPKSRKNSGNGKKMKSEEIHWSSKGQNTMHFTLEQYWHVEQRKQRDSVIVSNQLMVHANFRKAVLSKIHYSNSCKICKYHKVCIISMAMRSKTVRCKKNELFPKNGVAESLVR